MDIVRSYPSLANRSVSSDATIHDISDTGFFGTATLRLARGMHVRVRLPGAGVRDAEVAWAEFPNFACVFRDSAPAEDEPVVVAPESVRRSVALERPRRVPPKSRFAWINPGLILLCGAILLTLWKLWG